jgi:hypothetical protein
MHSSANPCPENGEHTDRRVKKRPINLPSNKNIILKSNSFLNGVRSISTGHILCHLFGNQSGADMFRRWLACRYYAVLTVEVFNVVFLPSMSEK